MPLSLSSSEAGPKFRVAICGASIAGLVLAITIGKYDPSIPIDLYELYDTIDNPGAGIALSRQTLDAMNELGLLDDFKQVLTQNPGRIGAFQGDRTYLRGDTPGIAEPARAKGAPSTMHRKEMVAILEKHLPAMCTVHFKKRLVNYMEPKREDEHSTSPIRLQFADGTTATTDVLIGADGIRSAVRKTLFEAASEDKNGGNNTDLKQYIDATFTGMTIYRCLIPAEALRKENPENILFKEIVTHTGKGKHIVTYPISKGTLINVVAIVNDPSLRDTHYEGHWTSDATRDELAEHYVNFEPVVRTIVELCEKPSKWALHVVKPLPFCVRERVALIGDACHATTPHFAAGAGQAIEDAFVLGRLIAHPLTSLSRIPDALRIYEEVRLPIARDVANISLSTGWMRAFMEPGYYDGMRKEDDLDDRGISAYEREGMETLGQEMLRRWSWIEELSGALHAWEDAESRLQAASVS